MAQTTLQELKQELAACEAIGQPPEKEPPASRPVDPVDYAANPDDYITICGNTLALRCSAHSKRTMQRCRQPAMRGKAVCKFHGGKSTGPRTREGRQRCAEARTIHGEETRASRRHLSQKSQQLRILLRVAKEHGLA